MCVSEIVRNMYIPPEDWKDRFMYTFLGLVCPNALEAIFEIRFHAYDQQWLAVIFGSILAFALIRFSVWARRKENSHLIAQATRGTAGFLSVPPRKNL